MFSLLKNRSFHLILLGVVLGVLMLSFSAYSFLATSETQFCISCHEMRVVAEQGWMQSKHYKNKNGVVAQCADCHLPPGLITYVTYKIRDGLVDLYVHNFGESDPYKMDWDRIKEVSQSHHMDSACLRCHENLTPEGLSTKGILAHREYLRGETDKNCIKCHDDEIHPKFKEYLFGRPVAQKEGALQ